MSYRLQLKNPELYHGKEKSRPYFEGWYFKQSGENTVCVIPGVYRGLVPDEDMAFIQFANETGQSFFFRYPLTTFHNNEERFEIWIDKNFFSMKRLILNINKDGICINGELMFGEPTELKTSLISPSIMGPFSYLPNMQCNHGVLSLAHSVKGTLKFNDEEYTFDRAFGYIEKDWGRSFPKSWIWMQCNDEDSSLLCSIANISYGPFDFNGLICVLFADDRQYRFATYNGGRAASIKQHANSYSIEIVRACLQLSITAESTNFSSLKAPSSTGMNRIIEESLNTKYDVTLNKRNKRIFSRSYKNGGLEMLDPEMLIR